MTSRPLNFGVFLTPPSSPDYDAGLIYIDGTQYSHMCGPGTIGLMATLEYLGRAGPGSYAIDARLRDAARFAPGFTGALSARGTVARNQAGYALQIDASGPGQTSATASGTVSGDFRTVDLSLSGTGQSAVINSLIQPRSVDGPVRFDLSMAGPPALSSLTGQVSGSSLRIASPSERLSIQNGSAICFSISLDMARSTSEKNGFGKAGGSGPGGRISASSASLLRAISSNLALSGSRP